MGQGIYWVQRHLADQRRVSAAEARVARINNAAVAFNSRKSKIAANVRAYAGNDEAISQMAEKNKLVASAVAKFIDRRSCIANDIEAATNGDLSKLATAAKNLIIACAKFRGDTVKWDSAKKTLWVRKLKLDFT